MGCSIFSAGNLRELDAARPSPIHYHSASVLGGMAGEFFGELKWMEIERKEKFGSAREALLHLRDTGVRTGLRVPLSRLLAALRPAELTYSATLLVGQL